MVNGNMSQDLYIQYTVGAQDMTSIKVHVNDRNQHIEYTVTGLNQGRKYNFSILAVNQFGETRSNQMECLTETHNSHFPQTSNEYYDLQKNNTAFQDPYTSLQNPIESRHHQEPSSNTYEECGNADDAAAYQNIENMKSGHKKAEKNMDIYDDVKN
ncbi:unnamed protein product [Mytilus coruscus]|uniref:Fibronectin type-III domain-containing protein n=1 Tax=Mytilus coruscus TaxID=42192 RepID=A0A6J8EPB6_MYTCO|nr:unnamed protein product [Mytilus coruscus]